MNRMIKRIAVTVLALGSSAAMAGTRLTGAGSTFVNPIMQRWVTEYQKTNPDVQIDYQSIGSGGGIKGITEKTIDFAGSDAPMSKKEQAAAGGEIVTIPAAAGAVVMAYNLPGFNGELKLSGDVIADIFTGKITKWNDAKIAAMNEGASLPDMGITPASRTDGSGTTYVFTNYLCTQSEDFKGSVGPGKQVKWPVGQGGKGSEGVTAIVQQTPGSIGYVELNYAIANKINFATLKNKDGKFIKASLESVSAAGTSALASMKDGLAVDLWNQSGETTYPISAFTYIIVYKDLSYVKDPAKAQVLVGFFKWAMTDGQKMAADMTYAPLSEEVQKKVVEAINGLTWGGKAVASNQ